MSWVGVAVVGGTAMKVGGGILERNNQLANAQRQADARNQSLQRNVGILNTFGNTNEGVFGANIDKYAQPAQAAQLAGAQTARSNTNVGNISAPVVNDTPIPADASPATRADLAKRMTAAHDFAVDTAKNKGKLGGYGDTWATNELRNAAANRAIGVVNNEAEGRKALIAPEGDLAAAAASKAPSIWGPAIAGAGSIIASYGGGKLGGAAGGGTSLTPDAIDTLRATSPGDV